MEFLNRKSRAARGCHEHGRAPLARFSTTRRGALGAFFATIAVLAALASDGVSTARAEAGTEDEGYALGLGNGGVMARRVRRQTLDRFGCGGLNRFQDTVLVIQRSVRAPRQSGDQFVRGFYRGYNLALRQAVHEARAQCNLESFNSGDFPGRFNGGVYCQVLAENPALIASYPFEPLYGNWAGDDEDVRASCRVEFTSTVNACAGAQLSDVMTIAHQVCN